MRLPEPISALCLFVSIMVALVATQPAFAVNPDEVLSDPVLEERARDLSATIRCMKCQNQSIDDSDADLARDLRILLRERLAAGDSDQEVLDFLVARYGEFVLLKPRFTAANLLLWAAPVLGLLGGFLLVMRYFRTRKGEAEPAAGDLTKAEHAKLTKILDDRE
ncbi:cytochrome c-type biogenesis protein [Salaquimonas pukyongi]|uniref:cytochrome c-type biogenesis protein n=1 Tax=Salaquimonas pukyongi TaxID=2712698 RepID=UPI00096B97A6|nr:cytochrome c-type biogenesis protein [Salaquimonas pukyongi]